MYYLMAGGPHATVDLDYCGQEHRLAIPYLRPHRPEPPVPRREEPEVVAVKVGIIWAPIGATRAVEQATTVRNGLRMLLRLISIIDKDIEIARRVAEQSQQQRNLPAMMNTVIGRVLHEFSQWH